MRNPPPNTHAVLEGDIVRAAGSFEHCVNYWSAGRQILPICPRCKRIAKGWPLQRADRCSPKYWAYCLRNL
jgi:hypothetical protein